MAFWLHQLSEPVWSIANYRLEMWEKNNENWRLGNITPKGIFPIQGDIIVIFYTRTKALDYGIVGWGVVMRYDPVDYKKRTIKEMRFRLTPPSDYLKMNPLWNKNINNIVNQIRGKQKQGTLWAISKEQMKIIRDEMAQLI